MREELLKELQEDYARRRENHEAEAMMRQQEIRTRYPEIEAMTAERQEMIFGSLRGILEGNTVGDDLPERMEKLNARIREALKKNGYPEDYLAPIYDCPVCRDTGYVGETVRDMCSCLKKEYQKRLRDEIGLKGGENETFGNYRTDIYPEGLVTGSSFTQAKISEMVRSVCEKWAEDWPNQNPGNLLILGKSGLGKTFFLHAMAARLLEKGADVLVISAYDFLEAARNDFFGRESDLPEIMNAGVLMLDDLGSEPLLSNITMEQVFNLINERQRKNLATVISSNLNLEELKLRYTERVVSRLSDKRNYNVLVLLGKDLRNGIGS